MRPPSSTCRRICWLLTLAASVACADDYELRVRWNPNAESDLLGYRIYSGPAPGMTTNVVKDVGLVTNTVIVFKSQDRVYLTMTAYNSAGLESDHSVEISGIPSPIWLSAPSGFQVSEIRFIP